MRKQIHTIFMFILIFMGFTTVAGAHMLWLNVNNYSPAQGEEIYIEIGFGHHFPADEAMKDGRIEAVYVMTPDNTKVEAEKVFPGFYKYTPQSKGTYRLVAALNPGFMSKTTKGRKMGNRKTLDDVVSCFSFDIQGHAIVTCGGSDGTSAPVSGGALDLLAVKPNARDISLQAMFNGAPLADASLSGACMTCPQDKENPWSVETKADAKGVAALTTTSKGPWLFMVRHKIPYKDSSICDDDSYCTTLTLGL